MPGWAWATLIAATIGPLLAWWTLRPWTICRPCDGHGTLRNRVSGKWAAHCRGCRGFGRVERHGRKMIRGLTGGLLFRNPPPQPDGQLFGRINYPFRRGRLPGARARRRRPR